jgi:hypothetical protein
VLQGEDRREAHLEQRGFLERGFLENLEAELVGV